MSENVNHPPHYGGEDNPYETIKVIEAMGIGYEFCIGNAVKYLMRAGLKHDAAEDLDKAAWYCARAAKISREDQERTYESHKKALAPEPSYQFPEPLNLPKCNGCLGTSGNPTCKNPPPNHYDWPSGDR